jgi:hypothetical protein
VDKPSDCDISAVLGMGFPAWRGGPLKHGDAVGAKTVLAKLQVGQPAYTLHSAVPVRCAAAWLLIASCLRRWAHVAPGRSSPQGARS